MRTKKNAIIDSSEDEDEALSSSRDDSKESLPSFNTFNEESDLEDSLHEEEIATKESPPQEEYATDDEDPDYSSKQFSQTKITDDESSDDEARAGDIVESTDEEIETTTQIHTKINSPQNRSEVITSNDDAYKTNVTPNTNKNEEIVSEKSNIDDMSFPEETSNLPKNIINAVATSDNEHDYGSTVDSESSVDLVEKSYSIVEVSSDEEAPPVRLKQTNIKSFMSSFQVPQPPPLQIVTREEYQEQRKKVAAVEMDLFRAKVGLFCRFLIVI